MSVFFFLMQGFDRAYSYHLLWGGSFLMAFSLFMLSLAKPNKFYQVRANAPVCWIVDRLHTSRYSSAKALE